MSPSVLKSYWWGCAEHGVSSAGEGGLEDWISSCKMVCWDFGLDNLHLKAVSYSLVLLGTIPQIFMEGEDAVSVVSRNDPGNLLNKISTSLWCETSETDLQVPAHQHLQQIFLREGLPHSSWPKCWPNQGLFFNCCLQTSFLYQPSPGCSSGTVGMKRLHGCRANCSSLPEVLHFHSTTYAQSTILISQVHVAEVLIFIIWETYFHFVFLAGQ